MVVHYLVFNSKKQNGQWFFIIDIQKLNIFVMFSTAKSNTVNGLSLSIFKNQRFLNILNSNSFSLPVIVVILMYLSLGTRASCIFPLALNEEGETENRPHSCKRKINTLGYEHPCVGQYNRL